MKLFRDDCIALAFIMTLSSCASTLTPDIFTESSRPISSIDVSVGEFETNLIVQDDANPTEQAITSTIVGASPGLGIMAIIAPSCTNPYSAAMCAVFIPMFALMTALGGTAGAIDGYHSGKMEAEAQGALTNALSDRVAQNALITKIVDYGKTVANRDFKQNFKDTPNIIPTNANLEVRLTKADGISGGSFFGSDRYAISLEARAKLISVPDKEVIADQTYQYISVYREPQQWAKNQGALLIDEINSGYNYLAEWIVDDFFLSLNKPIAQNSNKEPVGKSFALNSMSAPSNPIEYKFPVMPLPLLPSISFCNPSLFGVPEYFNLLNEVGQTTVETSCYTDTIYTESFLVATPVYSLQPTLKWHFNITSVLSDYANSTNTTKSSAYSETNISPDAELTKLRYEIRVLKAQKEVWRWENEQELRAITTVYEKSEITDTMHTLDKDLDPCSQYLWTVRALFDLDGLTKATEWAGNYWSRDKMTRSFLSLTKEGYFYPTQLRKISPPEKHFGRPLDYAFPFSTPCHKDE